MAELTNDLFPEEHSRLLLVEGSDDFSFFLSLAKELSVDKEFFIYNYQGRDNLRAALRLVVQHQRFEELRHLAIVRDADFDTDAFSSVRSQIERANRVHQRNKLPVPENHFHPTGEDVKVSAMILPNHGVEGMLENLILDALSSDPVAGCVEDFFKCVEETGSSLDRYVLSKAKTRVFLAGKAVDESAPKVDKETWELEYAFRCEWWTWDNPAFNQVKAFLRQLAEV